MKVVLLPSLDGTGDLFKPFIDVLPDNIDVLVISYPNNSLLSYSELVEFVIKQLPDEEYILLGESYSGYIAYQIALRQPTNLQSVIFVAAFLEAPRPFLLSLSKLLPSSLFSFSIPNIISQLFFFGMDIDKQVIELFKLS